MLASVQTILGGFMYRVSLITSLFLASSLFAKSNTLLFSLQLSNASLTPEFQVTKTCEIHTDKILRKVDAPALKISSVETSTLKLNNLAQLEAMLTIVANADDLDTKEPIILGGELRVIKVINKTTGEESVLEEKVNDTIHQYKDASLTQPLVNVIEKICGNSF
jgi:hypothetical protein